MLPDRLAVRLRVCAPFEAADLGVRLCQEYWRSIYSAYLVVLVPVALLAYTTAEIDSRLPVLVLWWAKPWLDRTILMVLARAAFGQPTRVADIWRERRRVWWQGAWKALTYRRFSLSRSAKLPVHQLELLRGEALRRRLRQLMRGRFAAARTLTATFLIAELFMAMALVVLAYMFVPSSPMDGNLFTWFAAVMEWAEGVSPFAVALVVFVPYLLTVAFLEPFYVSAGFAIYLNRRVELEAWDIEQDLRHAFAT